MLKLQLFMVVSGDSELEKYFQLEEVLRCCSSKAQIHSVARQSLVVFKGLIRGKHYLAHLIQILPRSKEIHDSDFCLPQ